MKKYIKVENKIKKIQVDKDDNNSYCSKKCNWLGANNRIGFCILFPKNHKFPITILHLVHCLKGELTPFGFEGKHVDTYRRCPQCLEAEIK